MNSTPPFQRISLQEILCFAFSLSPAEAQAVIEKRTVVSAKTICDRTHFDRGTVDRVLQNPSTVRQLRLNPNRIISTQIARIPHLKSERAKIVAQGQPYYAIAELEAATRLSRALLDQLFVIAPLSYQDKQAHKEITLIPVLGRYLIPAKTDLEATDPLESTGYVEVLPSASEFDFRIVQPSEFEADPAPHELKAAFAGNVHPVLRDAEGFERYLVPGSLDLWFRSDIAEAQCRSIIQTLGFQVTNATPKVGYYRVRLGILPDDRDVVRAVLAAIDRAQQRDDILFAEIDQVGFEDFGLDQSVIANDEEFEDFDRFWNYNAIHLSDAHLITKGSPNVTIIIIDSGARTDHEALQTAFRSDWQTLDLNFDIGVLDSERSPNESVIAHGTKVAGVIGQQNAAASAVAPNCRILPIKIPGQFASPAYGLRAAAIRQALTYLQPGERAVINLSWRTNGEHIGIREALIEAQNRGVAIVASAGNYALGAAQRPDELHYPSAHTYRYPQLTNLCTVAAVGVGDRKASYSYYGQQSITVAAPGGEKGSAGAGIYTTSTPEKYAYTCGTSFAAPHVAGLIALLFSVKPDLSAAEAIALLKDTADPIDTLNPPYAGMLGAGRINARSALERITPLQNQTHTIAATAGSHGQMTPIGSVVVQHGFDQTFAIVPDPDYQIIELLVDGNSVTIAPSYVFKNITMTHTIAVQFSLQQTEPSHYDTAGRLNINLATLAELTTLPSIGSWLADRIVKYRTTHGSFSSIWGLSLAGVSAWSIGQIKTKITA
ncbi:S8 family serine peptidase [Phormidesmis sp. 146-33]